jgi:pimeloyl-ACP methyl ester carboxylesterase
MNVYFISGLAADKRVFKYISLPPGFDAIHLAWINPQKNESLGDYALRMAEKIDVSAPFVIIGLSMGGMIASEIAHKFKPAANIIISSVPVAAELPPYMRTSGMLRFYEWFPIGLLKSATLMKRLFSTETADDKQTLAQMIRESDDFFIRWAMNAISTWQSVEMPSSLIHIHGTRDMILPMRYTKPTHIIAKAGHLMIMNRAKEINQILEKTLRSL